MFLNCRYRYRDPNFVNTLSSLLEPIYGDGQECHKDLLQLADLHMMARSHSLFLPTMLETKEETGSGQDKGQSGEEL